jgi:hypothetical protein
MQESFARGVPERADEHKHTQGSVFRAQSTSRTVATVLGVVIFHGTREISWSGAHRLRPRPLGDAAALGGVADTLRGRDFETS